ncbi:hypothetical protein RBWH47_05669 [Rhodopirellula baltica WH47]|uniref:Uncharacterized protein n=1 Tax=Rhodopirellula baltica WH47 TaxID=991778 RepID=F2AQZ2_RHOBT|nr:hypothetical protein RBWH47_05669 [Rhodopirellula baltica WH47]
MLGFFMRVRATEMQTDLWQRTYQPETLSSKPLIFRRKTHFQCLSQRLPFSQILIPTS